MTTDDVVILCAAGMLVTAYLIVGQKALFVAIRLYGLQSILLGVVAVAMGLTDHRYHLFIGAALTIGLKGLFIPWFLMRIIDRIGIHREIEPYVNIPSSLLICLGLTVVGYRVSTGLAEGGRGVTHLVVGVSLSMILMGLYLMVSSRCVAGLSTGTRPASAMRTMNSAAAARSSLGCAEGPRKTVARASSPRLSEPPQRATVKRPSIRAGSASAPTVISRLEPMPPNGLPVSSEAVASAKRPRARRPTRTRIPPASSRGAPAKRTGTSVVAATAVAK